IQYGLGKPGGAHSNIFCPFLGVQCKDNKKSCQGVKICKIAKPEFKDVTHSTLAAINSKCCYNHKTNRSNVNQYFIGCSAYVFGTRHRYISEKPNDDKNCLQKQKSIPYIIDGKVELLPLVKTGCNVIFHKYESLDLESCPYIVMVVKNTHSHPPSPPHRTPNHLQQDLK
ncbi:18653_t:CDS:2, partial [Rhizophagus irregularis]